MKIHRWDVVDNNGSKIRSIVTGKKDGQIAWQKMKAIYKDQTWAFRLRYAGTEEMIKY